MLSRVQQHTHQIQRSTDELDRKLEELALAAQNSQARSLTRQLALTRLISRIQQSGKLVCRGRYHYPNDVYTEALQETWLYISRKIENYKPEKGKVLAWANYILDKRFKDAIRRHNKNKLKSLDEPIYLESGSEATLLTLLDTILHTQNQIDDWEELQDYLEEDSKGIFTQEHIKNHPEANFRAIALRRLERHSWKDMSIEWGITISTLSSFYRRCVDKQK